MSNETKISVIIPVYNALEDVKKLLNSLNLNFDFSSGEVIVINDCSNKETEKYLVNFNNEFPQFILLKNEENLGFVKTCNRGMRLAKNEIIILLNSDTEVPSGFQKKIADCFNSDKKIGVASPVASHSGTYFIPMPEGYDIEQMNLLLDTKHKAKYPLILAAEGFCFSFRRELIDRIGYLDEIYGKGYGEEIDFAYRAIQDGWRNVLIDSLYVFHRRQASFGENGRRKLLEVNMPIFNKRWLSFSENYKRKHFLRNPIWAIYSKILPKEYFNEVFVRRIYNTWRFLKYVFQ